MVAEKKKKEVAELTDLLKQKKVVAVAKITALPARQFQEIRAKLRGKATIRVSKINLLKIAMKNAGREELVPELEGPVAIIFTDMDAFKLFNTVKKCRSKADAKAGQIAPNDIVVPAGDSGLPPGPALGDLKMAGINAKIDGASIVIMSDSTVAKKGDAISAEVATALSKLGVKPVEIGMDISTVLEEKTLFPASVLDVSTEEMIAKLQAGTANAFGLCMEIAYTAKETIEPLLQKAFRNAKAVGVEAEILDKGVIEDLLAKANAQALTLKS